MPRKINRILIPILLLGSIIFSSYGLSAAQKPPNNTYLPIISDDLSTWIGPDGGYVVTTLFDPLNPQIAYAGTWGAGVYKSLDAGQSWQPSNQGLTNYYINSLAIDPVQPSTLYAGTYYSQVFKSIDGGETWQWSGNGMQEKAIVYTIAIDPFLPTTLYAGTRGISNNNQPPWKGVVYRSANSGQSWEAILDDVGGIDTQDWAYSLVVNPQAHNMIYAAFHEHGPYRSTDYGASWFPINKGVIDYSGRVITISPKSTKSMTLYYGVWHNDGVYKSINGGGSWIPANDGVTYAKVYNMVIDQVYSDTVYLATFNRGILKTVDGGEFWHPAGLQDDQVYSLSIQPGASLHLLAGTSGDGAYRSPDGGASWIPSNSGLQNADVTSVVFSPSDPNHVYASIFGAGVAQSIQRDLNWEAMNDGLNDKSIHALVQNPAHPELLFALTDLNGLFRYNLNTSSGWESIGQGLPLTKNPQPAFQQDHPFATYDIQESSPDSPLIQTNMQTTSVNLLFMVFAPADAQTAYLGTRGSGVFRSHDAGATWQPAGLLGASVASLATDPANPELIYATTPISGSLKVSNNGGDTWVDAALPVTFYSLAAPSLAPGSVFAGTSNGIYRYTASGWTLLGLAGQSVTAIAPSTTQSGLIYAGTTSGAFFTIDNGLTWRPVSSNLNNLTIQSISIDPVHPNWVYFCTLTHGIYFASLRF